MLSITFSSLSNRCAISAAEARQLRVRDARNIWAVGDCALIINHATNQPCAPTGQFAERQGRQCAHNLLRVLRHEVTRPFAFSPLGQLCSLGGRSASPAIKWLT